MKKNSKEIEAIETLTGVIHSGDEVYEPDRRQIAAMLADKQVDEEFEAFYHEFMSSPRNQEQDVADGLESLNRLKRKYGTTQEIKMPPGHRNLFRRMAFRAAAIVIPLMLVGGIALYLTRDSDYPALLADDQSTNKASVKTVYEQTMDEEREIMLPDGSTVRLRRNASINYAADFLDNRVVELSGDAFFSVAKRDGQPFEVLYDGMTVRVLGTEFLLSKNPTSSMVTLKSGSVEVVSALRNVTLEPNQQLAVESASGNFSVLELTAADMESVLRGELILRKEPLDAALVKIGRFFGVNMDVWGLLAGSVTIDITADDRLDDVLFTVQQACAGEFEYEITGPTVIVRKSGIK